MIKYVQIISNTENMQNELVAMSARGQLTIPLKMRRKFSAKYFDCQIEGETIVLRPLKTQNDFLREIEAAEDDWEKNGGITLKQIKKKYKI